MEPRRRCTLKAARAAASSPSLTPLPLCLLIALLPVVMAAEFDSCARPDAVFASLDQASSTLCPLRHSCATVPDWTLCRECAQAYGKSYAFGAVASGDYIYIVGRA